ncbi:tetratricopeptide repeat protein [Desulfovibrio inopinatus]|uniref:tetratricopeptide repeat protein n=1 Tax=Desulfovibrio inopinatus TaxID=102109 RepID=UPI00048590ED|nr:hypothetical protein [Desulfovibrio inopinatus]
MSTQQLYTPPFFHAPRHTTLVYWLVFVCVALTLSATGCSLLLSSPQENENTEDRLYAQSMLLGMKSWQAGQIKAAQQMYNQALTRARTMDSTSKIADSAYNLAACHIVLHDWDAALPLLDEAILTGDRPADSLLLKTRTLRYTGQTEEARDTAHQALNAALATGHDEIATEARLQLGLLDCEAGQSKEARQWLVAAGHGMQKETTIPSAKQLAGCLANLDNAPATAALYFDEETTLLRDQNVYSGLPASLARAGKAYAKAGNHQAALDRFYRAARTASANQLPQETTQYATLGLEQARLIERTDYISLLQSFLHAD